MVTPESPAPRTRTARGGVVLGEVCEGRDNNLNLIRILAALGVLVGHGWPLTRGRGAAEPLAGWLGVTLGTLSVYTFFSISGFLVSRSFERQPGASDWIRARARRLIPGLFVTLALSVLVLGPLLTALPAGRYFSRRETWTYLPVNQVMILQQHGLPGVFTDNAFPVAVNGSLWTLRYEVLCYLGVLGIGMAGGFRRRALMVAGLTGVLAANAALLHVLPADRVPLALRDAADLALPFAIGVAFYVWRDRLRLHPAGIAVLAAAAALARGTPLYGGVFALALAYSVFWLGYVPGGFVRLYNRLGDFSYGVYIYAFPVQQTLAHFFPRWGPWENIAAAAPLTLVFAAASWTWIEKPILRGKKGGPEARGPSPTADPIGTRRAGQG